MKVGLRMRDKMKGKTKGSECVMCLGSIGDKVELGKRPLVLFNSLREEAIWVICSGYPSY